MKIVEIASSVVDSISHLATLPVTLPNWTNDLSPSRILTHLDSLMSSFRHKAAKSVIDLLCQKTAEVHARTGYCAPLSSRPLLDNESNHNQDPLDQDHDRTNWRQNHVVLPTFDDAVPSMETSLILGSANHEPHDFSDQHRDSMPTIGIDSPGELSPALFDHYVGHDIICSSQKIPDAVISLLMGNNEASVSTLAPFTPDHYELNEETSREILF